AAGSTGCSGSPPNKTCTPLWTGTIGAVIESSPAVAGGMVYVGANNGKLYAFDAAGSTNCSGTPKTCTPLWTGQAGGFVESSPTGDGGGRRRDRLVPGRRRSHGRRGRRQRLALRRRRRRLLVGCATPRDLHATVDGAGGRLRRVLPGRCRRSRLRGLLRRQPL